MKLDRERLEKAVANFVNGLDSEPDTLEMMSKVTKNREPLPAEVKNLVLSKKQQDELYITEADREEGKRGSSVIASVLSVNPDDYSDWQYHKVRQLELYKMSMDELYESIRTERTKHGIYYKKFEK
jgi:hypothetical protein